MAKEKGEIEVATANSQLANIGMKDGGLVIKTLDDIRLVAKIIFNSKLAPKSYTAPEQVFVGIQCGGEIGLKPMQALQSIAVIHGVPTLWGDAALGLVKRSGLLSTITEKLEGEGKLKVAICISLRVGQEAPVETRFSAGDAITAGLWGKAGTWKTHPDRMLKYKARAFNLRDNFPDVLMGMHLTEEMEGETIEALPECKTPPRTERRKVVSQDVTEPNTDDVVEQEESVPDTDGSTDAEGADIVIVDHETGEITKEITYDDLVGLFVSKLTEVEGTCSLTEYAAWVECLEEEECDEPEKFTDDMLTHLANELETNGIPDDLLGGQK